MSIVAETPGPGRERKDCTGCGGAKCAPLAAVVYVGSGRTDTTDLATKIVLCQKCARDAANAIAFMCIRDGGWSKLEPKKRKAKSQKKISRRSPR
jgi:hypothetical protein